MASNRKNPPDYDEEAAALPYPNLARKTSRQKREEMMNAARSRTHSNGSTLGAFYQEDAPTPKPAIRRRRSSRRTSTTPSTPGQTQTPKSSNSPLATIPLPTTSAGGSDLGDIAGLALAGLGDDDLSELMGASMPSSSKPKSRRPPPAASGGIQQSRSKGHTPRPPNSQLPTILDDSEHYHGGKRLDLVGGLPKNTGIHTGERQSMHKTDSLLVSDATDFHDDVATAMSYVDKDNNVRASLLGSTIFDDHHSSPLNFPPKAAPQPPGSSQQEEIANFAAMLHGADYGAVDSTPEPVHPLKGKSAQSGNDKGKHTLPYSATTSGAGIPPVDSADDDDVFEDELEERESHVLGFLDPTDWLVRDLKFDSKGVPFFDERAGWTIAGFVRYLLFNPIAPEFTSLQQFSWAVILGILMGFYTAFWKQVIEHSVDIMWKEIPEALLEWGVFTELDGSFPLYHWMWICPAFWGGVLSYIFAALPTPIPGQNEWITAVHSQGVQDADTFLQLFVLSTLGMASGLSLGPELPLVLTSGMIGSWLGIQCKQTVLQARVMNITAAGAAVGGFFGFPMAGALFVLEIPHRMGLQYFEALSPATIASIVAVLCNRLVTGNDVTGYYSYPFLTTSLPSEIFSSAILFGLFGALLGIFYAKTVLKLKGLVHDWFHAPHEDHGDKHDDALAKEPQETTPLVAKVVEPETVKTPENATEPPFHKKIIKRVHKWFCCVIPYEPHRALVSGVVAGAISGGIGMLFPQVMFWGEAQLQSMIDKGRTPLPIFGREDEPTAALTANAICMIDSDDPDAIEAGFSMSCAALITIAKIVVTGLSLGTGIVGGHFWGPLFAGCVASHFLVDVATVLDETIGFGGALAAYPCLAILCTMGSTHVVTFRAHTAIMLILTLTISAFDPENGANGTTAVAGDYSAVFPLLVVSVFVSLMVSRQTVFYKAQRSRVDISARPEVLCQPGQEGMPVVVNYDGGDNDYDEYEYDEYSDGYYSDAEPVASERPDEQKVTQEDIEKEFNAKVGAMSMSTAPETSAPIKNDASSVASFGRQNSSDTQGSRGLLPPRPRNASGEFKVNARSNISESPNLEGISSSRLDELLAKPMDSPKEPKRHRRIHSAPAFDFGKKTRSRAGSSGAEGFSGSGARHNRSDSFGSQASAKVMRVATVGQLSLENPSLMDQAIQRSATSAIVLSRHVRHPSLPSRSVGRRGHSRHGSASSIGAGGPPLQVGVGSDRNGLTPSEVERAFTSAVNQQQADTSNRTLQGIHAFAEAAGGNPNSAGSS